MRLATLFDPEIHETLPVFELPGGERIELRTLLRAPDSKQTLDELPVYFTDLAKTVEYLDDVIAAARAWATDRAEKDRGSVNDDHAAGFQEFSFCPPIVRPGTVREFNAFEEHARRQSLQRKLPSAWHDAPLFNFINSGSLVGHENKVFAPANCSELDFGLQLGLVIGRGGRNISPDQIWQHVAGFTIINGFCAMDRLRQEQALGQGLSKSRDFATAAGPYLVTLDALRDRLDSSGRMHLAMAARLNGREVGRGDAAAMSFAWPDMIAHASADVDLFPGDLLLSGTITGGCLSDYPEHEMLQNGDVVELEIERLGVLGNTIGGVVQPLGGDDEALDVMETPSAP